MPHVAEVIAAKPWRGPRYIGPGWPLPISGVPRNAGRAGLLTGQEPPFGQIK